jgi:hypothetical protein
MRSFFLLCCVVMFGFSSKAFAGVEDTLAGQVIINTKGFPKTLGSAASLKALGASKFEYDKEGKLTLYYMMFLKKASEGSGLDATIMDITAGLPGTVAQSFTFYLSRRGERILSSYLQLDEKSLPGDRKYRLVFSYKGAVVAKGEFFVKGREVKRSGKVDFTDEDTSSK